MKLNLPSTLTSQKISTLFLLTWLQFNGVRAGQNFSNCLARKVNNSYNLLINFSFTANSVINNGKVLKLCCTSSQCTSEAMCSGYGFGCSKIAQTIACSDSDSSDVGCGGIVGDTPITSNTTLGNNCVTYDLTTVDNYLSTIR